MKLALDTNRYTDLCRGHASVVKRSNSPMKSGCPSLCWRIARRPRTAQRSCPSLFSAEVCVGVLYADEQTTHHYGAVYGQLRKQGTPIPINDMWIAALVLQRSLVLCARDAHFDALPQLPRV